MSRKQLAAAGQGSFTGNSFASSPEAPSPQKQGRRDQNSGLEIEPLATIRENERTEHSDLQAEL